MDARTPPQYHGLGSVNSTVWSARTDGKPGFVLTFPKGGEPEPPPARETVIQFLCNSEMEGLGKLEPGDPTEEPAHFYHLVFESKYACPLKNNCTTPLGEWIGLWNGMILQFLLMPNNTGKLKVINSECVWNLAGFYDFKQVGEGEFIFTPSTCTNQGNPVTCGNCPVIEVNYEQVIWDGENVCRAFSVIVTRGEENALVKFQYVAAKNRN